MGLINANLLWMIAVTFAALLIGTGVRLVALRKSTAEVAASRIASLTIWWLLAALLSIAVLLGKIGAAFLLAAASFFALKEYLKLMGTKKVIGNATVLGLAACGAVHYGLILSGRFELAQSLFPIGTLLMIGAIRAATGITTDYIRVTGGIIWGAMLLIYGLSHALLLFEFDTTSVPWVGVAGWFLFLILLTEMNDIMQAIVGRKFGRHKISPRISPNKTYEGLMGGMVCTIGLSILLAPWLTTWGDDHNQLSWILFAILAGGLISITGFFGDLNMSGIKRDAGVKDGSNLLPGMGGMIDRVDSLTFTAPAFYYFLVWSMA